MAVVKKYLHLVLEWWMLGFYASVGLSCAVLGAFHVFAFAGGVSTLETWLGGWMYWGIAALLAPLILAAYAHSRRLLGELADM